MAEGVTPAERDQRLAERLEVAERSSRAGDRDASAAAYRDVLAIDPGHPRALNALGNRALSAGNAAEARRCFEAALARDGGAAPVWLNLAAALQALGEAEGELGALEGALAADPYFMLALLQKARWMERHGNAPQAVAAYQGLLDAAPPRDQLPAAFRAALEHGEALVLAHKRSFDGRIRDALGGRTIQSRRFLDCLEILAGRRQVYVQKPAGLHFPYLPAIQFFDPALFPWFAELEAATETIRREALGLAASAIPDVPYVRIAPGEPVNQWAELNESLDWGARFLWKDGRRIDETCALCPETAALLARLPLLDIPGRGPTVMFSTLQSHTRIPAHHGVTNTRSVVHLPLVVPDNCGFRVGSETRAWVEGKAWAFDDTIEHEAWNDSGFTRLIMIIDVWNPLLDAEERELLRITGQAFQGDPGRAAATI